MRYCSDTLMCKRYGNQSDCPYDRVCRGRVYHARGHHVFYACCVYVHDRRVFCYGDHARDGHFLSWSC